MKKEHINILVLSFLVSIVYCAVVGFVCAGVGSNMGDAVACSLVGVDVHGLEALERRDRDVLHQDVRAGALGVLAALARQTHADAVRRVADALAPQELVHRLVNPHVARLHLPRRKRPQRLQCLRCALLELAVGVGKVGSEGENEVLNG